MRGKGSHIFFSCFKSICLLALRAFEGKNGYLDTVNMIFLDKNKFASIVSYSNFFVLQQRA